MSFSKGSTGFGYAAYYADKLYNAPNGSVDGDFIWIKSRYANTLAFYLGNAIELTLPLDFNGENYVIGNDAFLDCSSLTSIAIPNSVTSIGNSAFSGCSGLKRVELDCSVIEGWFSGKTSIEEVVLGNSVTSIGSSAFSGCSGLTSVIIGNSVTSIGSYAFEGCKALKTVINLSNLSFSKGSTGFGYAAYYADKLYNAPNGSVDGDFIWIKSRYANTLAFYLGNAIELTLPLDFNGENYVIGNDAFLDCSSLTSIAIPNSVTSIGNSAFSGCSGLKRVELDCSVIEGWFSGKTSIEEVVLGNSVTSIGSSAFSGCSGLTSVIIGNSVTSIGLLQKIYPDVLRRCNGSW